MIKIEQGSQTISNHSVSPLQEMIFHTMVVNQETYSYPSNQHLSFELAIREQAIQAANQLFTSRPQFATFQSTMGNKLFWKVTDAGGLQLKLNTSPSKAILDIFKHGNLYAFECATAIIIIFYKSLLGVLGEKKFDEIFTDLFLYDWHTDSKLEIITKETSNYIFGDCLYFKNPDVDPLLPQWQGENTLYLKNNSYYGHGIGIKTKSGIIEALNKKRKPNATESARLLMQTTRLNYIDLFSYSSSLTNFSPSSRYIYARLANMCLYT